MSEAVQLDWSALKNLMSLCREFEKQSREGEEIELHDAAKKIAQAFGIEDLDKYAKKQFESAMENGVGQAFDKDSAKAIAAIFAGNCKPAMTLVFEYARGGKDATEFIAGLNKICFKSTDKLQSVLQSSLGISDEAASLLTGELGPYLVSVYCFAAAYKIYQSAARDAEAASERRIEAERLSNEAVAQLKARRTEMEALLNSYLLSQLIPFSEGVAAMDQAIVDDDDDGFIFANAELWGLFGRDTQYCTSSEFDGLMLSDDAFRL